MIHGFVRRPKFRPVYMTAAIGLFCLGCAVGLLALYIASLPFYAVVVVARRFGNGR